jgi:hypothetical protein
VTDPALDDAVTRPSFSPDSRLLTYRVSDARRWQVRGIDDLVSIAGIAGYSHDGQVLYLAAAQSSTGIPLPDIVRYADDPTDPYAPLVAAQRQEMVGRAPPTQATMPAPDAEPVNQTEHRSLVARLLPASAAVRVEGQTIHAQTITVALASTQTSGCCPACGAVSQRIHGSYVRTLADCSWAEHQVVLRVQARRFERATPAAPPSPRWRPTPPQAPSPRRRAPPPCSRRASSR